MKGFSLLELIIYIGLIALLIPVVTTLVLWTIDSNATSRVTRELEQEGLRALQFMVRDIRNAHTISRPTLNESDFTFTIVNSSDPNDTITYVAEDGVLMMSKSGGSYTAVTSNKTAISSLTIINVSQPGTPGALSISFTLRYKKQEKKFYVSAALREK